MESYFFVSADKVYFCSELIFTYLCVYMVFYCWPFCVCVWYRKIQLMILIYYVAKLSIDLNWLFIFLNIYKDNNKRFV